jgi:hypothetical protein
MTGTRTCEGCSLCCKLVAVPDLDKPAGKWCQHCSPKDNLSCTIYESRPGNCQDFQCLWLAGYVDIDPRKSKAVFASGPIRIEGIYYPCVYVFVDQGREDGKELMSTIEDLRSKIHVLRLTGGKRRLFRAHRLLVPVWDEHKYGPPIPIGMDRYVQETKLPCS